MESPSKELEEEETKLEKVLLLYVVVAAAIAVCFFSLQNKKSNLDFYDVGSEASPASHSLSIFISQ